MLPSLKNICRLILQGDFRTEKPSAFDRPAEVNAKLKRLRLQKFAIKKLRRKNPFRGIVGPRVERGMRWIAPPQFEKECILRH